jgi:hypothetical protein
MQISMLPEQFQIALERTRTRNPKLITAARVVLVDGAMSSEVAERMGIDAAHVRRAVHGIREKWQTICSEQGWECLPIALPRSSMKLVLEMQREQLDRFRAKERETKKRRTTAK